MHNTIELPRQVRGAEVRAQSFNEEANTIDIVWTTGARVRRYSWSDGPYDEELEVSASAVRLERLNAGAPFLNTHDSWSLENVIGNVVPGTARIENGLGVAKVQLSKREDAAGIVQDIRDGVIRNISVGYRIHRVLKEESDDTQPALFRVTDWEPLEISAVPIPADPGAQIRSDAGTNTVIIERSGASLEGASMADQNTAAEATRGNDTPVAPVVEQRDVAAEQARIDAAVAERVEQAISDEAERVAKITELAARARMPEFGADHVRKRTSLANFRVALLDAIADRDDGETAPRASVGEEHHEKRAALMQSALLHRADPAAPLADGAREYRGFSLMDMAREALEVRGIRTRGMSRNEIAGAALAQRSGYGSTSDFPIILGNVVNTTLRAGYEAAGQTFRPLVREVTVSDFKAVNRAQLGEGPAFDKVNESGEYKRGSLAEGKESYKIATYGKVIAITRQVIVNDDMNAFGRIPQLMGGAAAQLESDLVWAQILGNPTMGDGTALFHANHGNLPTAAAFDIAPLGLARAAMAKQTGLDGKTVLNIRPMYLIVPVALETTAEQKLKSVFYPDTSAGVATNSMKKLEIIVEARLDNGIAKGAATPSNIAGSATAWYLAASPAQIDTVELAYLEGNRGLYIESRQGFEVDGLEVKARLDVGAKTMEHRGLLKNAGA
ncbi:MULTISPECIES: prohead protease/major capsid protein fusion protein [unclassified Chelatococcus]|uniref:prohead protease/major capsid protein fusion protein n=1 Tax=unclassified Chelatococcus TaxID=2638111 RepID=UPI001BCF8FC4|nr:MULTISPECIES: prohead protease/major capsid protein fusion protein [unclassified Chelatococcus]MBS7737775.1 HK97 family phage prohead protease [Chelatococcus sp. HY11]MCO5079231.1 HK97 family phage prohead protease [Chelatococcus sp.]CAH1665805.1 ATP-dependent Clp protease proteolytic subunit [Hyphomicrobiales bacterium]CAH1681096.1 ATP-dependent Clp protease proteolytic subunit [Hyphomicrobiales bacterium]